MMRYLSEWQYSYKKDMVSLGMVYGNEGKPNTYHFYLHYLKVWQGGFVSDLAAKNAAKEYLDNN